MPELANRVTFLNLIGQSHDSDGYEQTAGQTLLAQFWRPVQSWFGQRINQWQAAEGKLQICVDSRTGEPCEFPSEQGWLEQHP